MYIYIYIHIHIIYQYICIYIYICIIDVYTYICIHVYVHIYIYIHNQVHIYIYIYIYMYTWYMIKQPTIWSGWVYLNTVFLSRMAILLGRMMTNRSRSGLLDQAPWACSLVVGWWYLKALRLPFIWVCLKKGVCTNAMLMWIFSGKSGKLM